MLGRILFALVGTAQIAGPFIADFNHTHVLNPNWPPHARFHNGQTMSMGICLGLSTIYFAFRSSFSSSASEEKKKKMVTGKEKREDEDEKKGKTSLVQDSSLQTQNKIQESSDLFTAAIFGSVYWITGVSAIFYPGSLAVDPEFGTGFPQLPLFVGMGVAAWTAWWWETRTA